jgi:hypothetical protein
MAPGATRRRTTDRCRRVSERRAIGIRNVAVPWGANSSPMPIRDPSSPWSAEPRRRDFRDAAASVVSAGRPVVRHALTLHALAPLGREDLRGRTVHACDSCASGSGTACRDWATSQAATVSGSRWAITCSVALASGGLTGGVGNLWTLSSVRGLGPTPSTTLPGGAGAPAGRGYGRPAGTSEQLTHRWRLEVHSDLRRCVWTRRRTVHPEVIGPLRLGWPGAARASARGSEASSEALWKSLWITSGELSRRR